jgi:hypothetical protein
VFEIYEECIYGRGRIADSIYGIATALARDRDPTSQHLLPLPPGIRAFLEDGAYWGYLSVLTWVSSWFTLPNFKLLITILIFEIICEARDLLPQPDPQVPASGVQVTTQVSTGSRAHREFRRVYNAVSHSMDTLECPPPQSLSRTFATECLPPLSDTDRAPPAMVGALVRRRLVGSAKAQ